MGPASKPSKCGFDVKIEVVADCHGTPLNHLTAAIVAETALALTGIPKVIIPVGVPVIVDSGYDSDPLREDLAEAALNLVAHHRKNGKIPKSADGSKLRRYIVEGRFAWLRSSRTVVTRFERNIVRYDGLIELAFAFIALNSLL